MPSAVANIIRVHTLKDFKYICRVNNYFTYDREIDGGYGFFNNWCTNKCCFMRDGCEDELTLLYFKTKELEIKCMLYLCKKLGMKTIGKKHYILEYNENSITFHKETISLKYKTFEETFNITRPYNKKVIIDENEFVYKKLDLEVYSLIYPWNL